MLSREGSRVTLSNGAVQQEWAAAHSTPGNRGGGGDQRDSALLHLVGGGTSLYGGRESCVS